MASIERQFIQLTSHVLDGVCTDDERAEVTRLASRHPELAAGVVDEAILHALLNWHSGNITDVFVPPEYLDDVTQDTTAKPACSPSAARAWRFRWAIAAILLFACGVATWQGYYALQAADPVIADIVGPSGVRWADKTTALSDGKTTIVPGRLASLGGEYTLQFRSGPTVHVVGAASLDIKSNMLIQLDQGQVTAQVPQSSIGFAINSPLVNVIDQGTQFGISVGSGRADVVVFDGKVDVQSKTGNGGQTRLTQGDCIQIDRRGAISRFADVRRDVQGRWWTDDRLDSDRHMIAGVSDNIHAWKGKNVFFCYQTTFDGLHEDALAYSDNPHHQWNGLTGHGLPDFLRGADYIKTFNDFRYMEDFEMKVELTRPANLYIFFDDRVEPPDWLKANFEDTGVDIGLDEGPWLGQVGEENRKFDVHTTAVGGGNSIDNIFSVWRRRCPNGGTISLGHGGVWGNDRIGFSGKGGRAMYGVAATPLNAEGVVKKKSSGR